MHTTGPDYVRAGELVKELTRSVDLYEYKWAKIKGVPAASKIMTSPLPVRRAVIQFTSDFIVAMREKWNAKNEWSGLWFASLLEGRTFPRAATEVCRKLLHQQLEYPEDELVCLIAKTASIIESCAYYPPYVEALIRTAERFIATKGISPGLKFALEQFRKAHYVELAPNLKIDEWLKTLINGGQELPVRSGEAWSDAVLEDLQAAPEAARGPWMELLTHCKSGTGSSPSLKWQSSGRALRAQLGSKEFRRRILAWFPLVDKPRTEPFTDWHREYQPDPNQLIIESQADIIRGLVWCCAFREDKEIARALTALALSAYRKVPKIGPRAVKIGNACIYALGAMPGMEGVGALALLKVRVKFGTAQKMIAKALEAAAVRVALPREDLEEMAVPAYGLTEVGRCTEAIGEFTAQLNVTGSGTELVWLNAQGKPQKSIPAIVKSAHAEDLKELQTAAKDIQRMLPAQRERIDTLFLQQKSWPLEVWRNRYLDHPLVGVIARRLIWEFTTDGKTTAGIYFDKQLSDLDLRPISHLV